MKQIEKKQFKKVLKRISKEYGVETSEETGGNHSYVLLKLKGKKEKLPIAFSHGKTKRNLVPEYVYKKELAQKLSKLIYGNMSHIARYKKAIDSYIVR